MKKIFMALAFGILFAGNLVLAAEEDNSLATKVETTSAALRTATEERDEAKDAFKPFLKDERELGQVSSDISRIHYLEQQTPKDTQRIEDLKTNVNTKLKVAPDGTPQTYDTIEPQRTAYNTAETEYQAKNDAYRQANSEYRAAEGEKTRDKALADMKKLAGDSESFDTQEFLTVGGEGDLHLDSENADEDNLIQRILSYLIMISGTFGVLMLIVGGFFMVTSEGDDNRLQKGKNIFLYTILGLVMIFVSYIVVQFVISLLFS